MLTPEQRARFDASGIVKIDGAFSADEAAAMRDVVWRELHRRYDIDRHDRSTWHRHPPTGLKGSKTSRAFAPVMGEPTRRVLDDVFGPGSWQPPKHYGQVLVTMPGGEPWRVPGRNWHADFQYHGPAEPPFAVKVWALFGDVEPGAGGTPQLVGSHRLVARYLDGRSHGEREYKRVRDGFLRSHPWLRALTVDDGDPDRNARFMREDADVDGLPARVVECTGKAGDIYVTHPWVMHSIAANAGAQPRFMRSLALYRRVASDSDPVVAAGAVAR
ncbi:MAG TPA: phytanoyl-CoA dioxygenase family protein [Acidimicrobiia bacterium]